MAIDCLPDATDSDVMMYMQPTAINGTSVAAFVDALCAEIAGPIVLLWDGLAAHHSKIVKERINRYKDRLRVYRFPAYAPELNPVEYMLSAIKGKDVANLCAVSIDHVARKLEDAACRFGHEQSITQGFLIASRLFEDTA